MVWLNLSAKRRRYSVDLGHTLLRSLPAGNRKIEIEEEDAETEKAVSRYGPTRSEVVPLEKVKSYTSSSCSREELVRVLIRPLLILPEQLRKCTGTRFEVTLRF